MRNVVEQPDLRLRAGLSTPGFPVSPPGEPTWPAPVSEPIVGPEAKQDLREIKKTQRTLAKTLARQLTQLLDRPLSLQMKPVRDPAGVGPRFYVDLEQGYVAVFWILGSPGGGLALWVERVVLSSVLHAAFDDLAREGA